MSPATLPRLDHGARRDRLRAAVARAGADVLLVTTPANVRYLTGFTGSNGQVLVGGAAGDDRLVTDDRYVARAADEAPGIAVHASRDPAGVALEAAGGGRLGVEAHHVTWQAADRLRERATRDGVEVVATTGLVEDLRVVKDDREVARLARACDLTTQALTWLLDDQVAAGRTERELATALERRFVDLGADGVGFPSIVAGGPNAAVPHHAPTARPLVAGDLLTIDCGTRVDGYHADCTRTVAIGRVAPDLAAVHDLVRAAQAAGRAAAVSGATAGDVDRAARDLIVAADHGDHFVHGTGHGVGLEVHEAPAVAREARATLVAGMALTVEPGVYLPGVGGVRIEDTIVVATDGPARTLTTAPRDLRVI